MKLIAKRGLWTGPNKETENTLAQIQKAIEAGYDVEIDVMSHDGELYLGHDGPQEKFNIREFNSDKLWIHAKNLEAYEQLRLKLYKLGGVELPTNFNRVFIHDEEDYAYISSAYAKNSLKWMHGRIGKFVYNQKDEKVALYRDNFKLDNVFIDVDGCMSQGKYYNIFHDCVYKNFVDIDYTSIKRFKAAGKRVILVSGDKWNKGMAEKRGIEFIHTDTLGPKSKLNTLTDMGFNLETSSYIGDDWYDLALLNKVGYPFCPNSAITKVKNESIVLDRPAGTGVLAEMLDWFIERGIVEDVAPIEG